MKILRISYLLLLACVLITSACDRDTIDDTQVEIETPTVEDVEVNPLVARTQQTEESAGMDLGCFTVNYPFSLIDADGNTYTINSEADWETIGLDESVEIVEFGYPLDITYSNGDVVSIADTEELFEAFASCPPQGGWDENSFPAYEINLDNSCYSIVYPISLVDIDGNELVINNEEEMVDAITSDLYFFVFPFSLEHSEGEVIEVSSNDDIFNALLSCSGWEPTDSTGVEWENGFEYIGCYTVEFPLDVINGEGDVVTVNDHMELCDLMLYGDFAGYAYPLSLVAEDGTVTVVNNDDELYTALEECPDWGGGVGTGDDSLLTLILLLSHEQDYPGCFTLNFPVTMITADGGSFVANTAAEIFSGVPTPEDITGAELPLTVTLTDGTTMDINSSQEANTLIAGCE